MNEKLKELKNRRFRQLAEQAKLKTELWNNPEPFVIYKEDVNYPGGLEKFAELIIRECAQVSEDDITDGDACCTNTADRIARQIKKHFGVEE